MNHQENERPSQHWQAVWQQHSGWLRTVLVARLRDGSVADELLQEVAVIAWRKRDQLSEQEKMAPWLYRIAIRQVQMFWRKQASNAARWQPLNSRQHDADEKQTDPLHWVTSLEVHQQVRDALEQLSSQDREILMLKHIEGWTYQKIASHLGISFDKVVYRLGRARSRLRGQLATLEYEWGNK